MVQQFVFMDGIKTARVKPINSMTRADIEGDGVSVDWIETLKTHGEDSEKINRASGLSMQELMV
jgi:hypothetical protein